MNREALYRFMMSISTPIVLVMCALVMAAIVGPLVAILWSRSKRD